MFVGRVQYFVGVVQVEGTPKGMEPRVLLTSSRLRLGQPLSEETLAAAQRHLSEVLVPNAYYRAVVRYHLIPNPATLEAGVVFSVFAGKPARLSGVEFEGQVEFPPQRLAKRAAWRHGMQLTSARVERGLARLRRVLRIPQSASGDRERPKAQV